MKATDQQILEAYQNHRSCWKAAESLGMCGQSVHERLSRLGVTLRNQPLSEGEKLILRREYEEHASAGTLASLAARLGRTKQFICRYAGTLGMTDQSRRRPYAIGRGNPGVWSRNPHPRGMAGKKHSEAVRATIAQSSKSRWDEMTKAQREAHSMKMRRARKSTAPRMGASWKSGWRVIGSRLKFYRSRWEANYARYLEWLRVNAQIRAWEHEPETFWFDGIRRGTMSYLPDFRVTENDGRVRYHEVKGWMDQRSKTQIARMAKYHPEVELIVIEGRAYRAIARQIGRAVEGWE